MTTKTSTIDTTPVVGDDNLTVLVKHAIAFDNAHRNVTDLEALLTEAQTVRAERHLDVLVAIGDLLDEGVKQATIAKALADAKVKAFGKDLVSHAVRAVRVVTEDDAEDLAVQAFALRCAITNAATNRKVSLKDIDAALAGVTSTAKAVAIVDGLVKAEPVDETDGDGDGDGEGEGEGGKGKSKTDADRLTAIANTLKGMKRDGTATPEAVAEIVTALTALVQS